MRKQMVLNFVLVSTVLSGIAGCSDMPRRSKAEARFCADNEILTYDPVDFDKTVITVRHIRARPFKAAGTCH